MNRIEKLDRSIEQFIKNQQMMRLISKSRNANHYLILQPHYGINKGFTDLNTKIYIYAYQKIMESNFCTNNCLDYSQIFLRKDLSTYMDNFTNKYKDEIYIDNIHLSDRGTSLVANKIIKEINF